MKNSLRVTIAVLIAVGCGCVTKEMGPNLDVVWNVPAPSPDKIPMTVNVLDGAQPRDAEVVNKCYALLAETGSKAGLAEVFAFTAGEDVNVPEATAEVEPQPDAAENKKDKKKGETPKEGEIVGLRKVDKEEITGLALTSADLGVVALEKDNLDAATRSLDIALQMMTSFEGNEKNLKKAVSLWGSESMKDFKGEPHERAMVFFWRGLAYLAKGDVENARVCFKRANLEDQFAKDSNQRGNWIVADIMERQCSAWIGDGLDVSIAERMQQAYQGIEIPPASKEDTVAIVFALGYPPLKQASGYHGSLLAYERADVGTAGAAVLLAGQTEARRVGPSEDVVMQAVSRGRRLMDERLAKEAKTKDDLKKAGDIMEQVGGQLPYIGLLFQIGGQAMRGAAAKTKAYADTRSLLSIPSDLAVAFVRPGDVPENAKLQVLNQQGNVLAEAAMPALSDSGKPTVVLVRYKGFPTEVKPVIDPNAPKEEEQPKVDKKGKKGRKK